MLNFFLQNHSLGVFLLSKTLVMIRIVPRNTIAKILKTGFNVYGERFERFIMNGILNFFKDIFMILPEQNCVGLSRINPIKVAQQTKKSSKKNEPTLSELMRKAHKKLEV